MTLIGLFSAVQQRALRAPEGNNEERRRRGSGSDSPKLITAGCQAHTGGGGPEPETAETMTNEGIEGTESFSSPGKGRGLRAVRHFAVGELVFACPAYSYVLTVNERGAYCEQCFTR